MGSGGAFAVFLCGIICCLQASHLASKPGQIIIGVLLPITKGPTCQSVVPRTIPLVETCIYEMRKIISKLEAEKNISLGYDIRDSCFDANVAINNALAFVSGEQVNSTCRKKCLPSKIVAVVGPEKLENVPVTAGILSFHRIPQVIYTAKTRLLSNQALYGSLTSYVPSITDTVSALTSLVAYFGWKTVNVVGFDDMYGREMSSLLIRSFRANNICISTDKLLEVNRLDVQIPHTIAALRSNPQVTVTLLVARPEMAAKVLDEARRQNLTAHVWIGSESWSTDNDILTKYKDVLEGMLGIGYPGNQDKELLRFLEKETRGLTYADWFKRLFRTNVTSGFNKHVIQSRDLPLGKVYIVQNALQAIGSTLEKASNFQLANIKMQLNRVLPKHTHRQTEFTYLNYQRLSTGESKLVTVGSWRKTSTGENSISVNRQAIQWDWTDSNSVPFSGLVKPCGPGTYIKEEPMKCGWICVRCPLGTYSVNYSSPVCVRCPVGEIPDQHQIQCVLAEEEYVRPFGAFGVIILSASVVGFVVTGLVLGIFLKYQNTPVVKASNIVFCLFTLVLLLVWFMSSALFLFQPTPWICKLRTAVIPLLYTSVSALLLTKTKRLIRIFSALKRNRFLSNYWYSFVACSIVLVQVILLAVYLAFFPPDRVVDQQKDLTVSMHCSRHLGLETASFTYNCLLALLCAMFAVKSRNLPETYSEAKHICFAMLAYLIAFMAYFFGYYGIPYGKLKAAVPSFGVILGAYAVLLFIFVPKIRVIIFLPEKNTKSAALAATRKYSVDVAFGIQMSMYSRACERRHTLGALPAYSEAKAQASIPTADKNCNSLDSKFSRQSIGDAIKEDESETTHGNRRYSLDEIKVTNNVALRSLEFLTPNGVVARV